VDYGHIRAVIMLNHEFQNMLLQYVANNQLSVRETEKLVREKKYFMLDDKCAGRTTAVRPSALNEDLKSIVEKFSATYGNNASIKAMSSGRIRLSIEFECVDKTYVFLKGMSS